MCILNLDLNRREKIKTSFMSDLIINLGKNWHNNFENNFDFLRFGFPERMIVDGGHALLEINRYQKELDRFYSLLEDDYSRFIFIQVLSFRILGHRKIKLPLSVQEYFNTIDRLTKLIEKNEYIESTFPGLKNIRLFFCDLNLFGFPLKIYTTPQGIISQFIVKNYQYNIDEKHFIGAKEGDVVIDGGACWGDTSLYFATQVGKRGKVYSFEFIPSNLSIMHTNLSLNPEIADRIYIIPKALWCTSGIDIFFKDRGPGSYVGSQPCVDFDGSVKTISIDLFVDENKIEKVDLIKMDIEGSEQKAIEGSINTLKKFRPKLAICIYHNFANDFARIPNTIEDLNLGYRFFIDHFSIHHEETVLFATCEDMV